MDDLELTEKLRRYAELYDAIENLNKELEPLKEEIKKSMKENKLDSIPFHGRKFVLQKQDRSKIDEEALVSVIKEKISQLDEEDEHYTMLSSCIISKEVPNEVAVKDAVFNEALTLDDVSKATKTNIIYALKLEKPKEKK